MSIASVLSEYSNEFTNLFEKDEDLCFDEISYIKVHASTIVTQCMALSLKKYAWFRLNLRMAVAFSKVIIDFSCRIINDVILKKSSKNNANELKYGSILFLVNTRYAFEEIHLPLIKEAENNSIKTDVYNIRSMEKFNSKSLTRYAAIRIIAKDLTLLLRILSAHARYAYKKTRDGERRKAFCILYSLFSNILAIRHSITLVNQLNESKSMYKSLVYDDINDPATRLVALYCKKKNVKVNVMQFGHYDRDSVEWSHVIADRIFSWGEEYKKLFNDVFGVPSDIEVLISGSPRFDYIFSDAYKNEAQISQNLAVKKYGLIFSTYGIPSYSGIANNTAIDKIKSETIECFKRIKNQNYQLLIKPHPLESDEDIKRWVDLSDDRIQILNKNFDARYLINKSSFVVTFGSGLTIDALISNKKVLIPDWSKEFPWELKFLEYAGAIRVKNKHVFEFEMTNSFNSAEQNENLSIRRFVNNNCCVSNSIIKYISANATV